MMDSYEIIHADQDSIHYFFDWAKKEQWNPGIHDDKTFITAYPDCFYLGLLDGTPVSCLAASVYQRHFAFIGYYIVAQPENRQKSLGLSLWNYVFGQLENKGINNMGLDAVMEQAANYAKSGFRPTYKHCRYTYTITGREPVSPEILKTTDDDHQQITLFDSQFVAEPRPVFIQSWLNNRHSRHAHIMDGSGKKVTAYGGLRKSDNGYRAGPIYADSTEQAADLLYALTHGLPRGELVYLDIPECNTHSMSLVNLLSLQYTDFECLRMYRGIPPSISENNIFAVSSLETG